MYFWFACDAVDKRSFVSVRLCESTFQTESYSQHKPILIYHKKQVILNFNNFCQRILIVPTQYSFYIDSNIKTHLTKSILPSANLQQLKSYKEIKNIIFAYVIN